MFVGIGPPRPAPRGRGVGVAGGSPPRLAAAAAAPAQTRTGTEPRSADRVPPGCTRCAFRDAAATRHDRPYQHNVHWARPARGLGTGTGRGQRRAGRGGAAKWSTTNAGAPKGPDSTRPDGRKERSHQNGRVESSRVSRATKPTHTALPALMATARRARRLENRAVAIRPTRGHSVHPARAVPSLPTSPKLEKIIGL